MNGNWYYWLIIIGFLALFYVLLVSRQKKQEKQSIQMMNSFQVGDKVVTHIGVFGKIKKIYNTTYGKCCLLEIGTSNKLEIELDMRFIAGKDEKVLVAESGEVSPEKVETKQNDENVSQNIKPNITETKTNKSPSKKSK